MTDTERVYIRVDQETGDVIYVKTYGLSLGGLVSEVALNPDTWEPLPLLPLVNRNAICIQNRSDKEIKINYKNDISGYVGMAIPPKAERFYDITDQIVIYAKSSSGTPTINVEEIA